MYTNVCACVSVSAQQYITYDNRIQYGTTGSTDLMFDHTAHLCKRPYELIFHPSEIT